MQKKVLSNRAFELSDEDEKMLKKYFDDQKKKAKVAREKAKFDNSQNIDYNFGGKKTDTGEGNEKGSINKSGAKRAEKYSSNWREADLEDIVNRFAPNSTPITTKTGKIIYRNDNTGIQVVYDKSGDYFRIEDTKIKGRRRYLDAEGNSVSNKIVNGKQMGRTKDEYETITHFKNKKKVK